MQQTLPDLEFPIFNPKRLSKKSVNFDITDYVNKTDLSTQILSGQLSTPALTTQSIQFNGSTQTQGFTNDDKANLDNLISDTRTDENTEKLSDIQYNDSLLKTTINNNCHINNLTCGNINVSHLSNTTGNLQTQINNINAAANAITYDSNTQITYISNNLTTNTMSCTNLTATNLVSNKTTDLQNQITNLQTQITNLSNSLSLYVPVGAVLIWTSPIIPTGFWNCNGGIRSKMQYPDLYNIIGDTYLYNRTPSFTHFYLPDFRGMFLRGGNYNEAISTSISGKSIGEYQEQSVQEHNHIYYRPSESRNVLDDCDATGKSRETVWDNVNNSANTQLNITSVNETRPHNISVNYIIKY